MAPMAATHTARLTPTWAMPMGVDQMKPGLCDALRFLGQNTYLQRLWAGVDLQLLNRTFPHGFDNLPSGFLQRSVLPPSVFSVS